MIERLKKYLKPAELLSLSIIVFLALLFRSLFFEPFTIPSGSMKPNLLIGDFIFVSKYSYGYSRYSFPFGVKLFDDRILEIEPERGDVAVFKLPSDNSTNYIKRVIGLPGDKIDVVKGVVYINNIAVKKERIENFSDFNKDNKDYTRIARFIETLPNGVSYEVLDYTDNGSLDNVSGYVVPENHYFMLGDNRDNSLDSRTVQVGYVPKVNLVGKARRVFFSSPFPIYNMLNWVVYFRFNRLWEEIK